MSRELPIVAFISPYFIADLSNAAATPNTLAGYHWTFDTAGDVTNFYSLRDTSGTPTSSYTSWGYATYGYDPSAQLNSASYTNFNDPPDSFGQNYDDNGNRNNSGTAVAAGNRVLYDGTYYYTFDAEGNRTAQFQSSSGVLDSSATDITTYQWNNQNQLIQVNHYADYTAYLADSTTGTGNWQVQYGVDAFGNTVSRTPTGDTPADDSGAEFSVYDGQNLALVLNADGEVIEREFYAPAVDLVLASEAGAASTTETPGTVDWYLTDNQGTVRDVAEYNPASGGSTSLTNHLIYTAFGQVTSPSSPSDLPTFTYKGQWQDPDTSLQASGPSWYDAVDGALADPNAVWQTTEVSNPYPVSGNDPTFANPGIAGQAAPYGNPYTSTADGLGASGSDGAAGTPWWDLPYTVQTPTPQILPSSGSPDAWGAATDGPTPLSPGEQPGNIPGSGVSPFSVQPAPMSGVPDGSDIAPPFTPPMAIPLVPPESNPVYQPSNAYTGPAQPAGPSFYGWAPPPPSNPSSNLPWTPNSGFPPEDFQTPNLFLDPNLRLVPPPKGPQNIFTSGQEWITTHMGIPFREPSPAVESEYGGGSGTDVVTGEPGGYPGGDGLGGAIPSSFSYAGAEGKFRFAKLPVNPYHPTHGLSILPISAAIQFKL